MNGKVCVDARMLVFSGIGTYLQKLIPRMERSLQMTLLIRKSEEKWAKEHFSSDLLIVDVPIYTIKEQVMYPFTIPACNLFWSPHYNIPLFPILAKKRAVTIHDVCHLAMPHFFPKWKRIGAGFLLKEAVRRSDLVLTVSEFSKKEIGAYLPIAQNKIQVVANGVEKRSIKGGHSLESLGIHRPFILYVGNNKPHKNLDRLLRAFFLLPAHYELVLVSSEKDLLREDSHDRIKRFHQISEEKLSFLYEKAQLLIQPSLYEGFGLTPLEAMSSGCPVIASKIPSLQEVCGEAAYYVNPYDEKALYKGMKKVLESQDLQEQLIKAGHKQEKLFSWDKTAEKLIELFFQEGFL